MAAHREANKDLAADVDLLILDLLAHEAARSVLKAAPMLIDPEECKKPGSAWNKANDLVEALDGEHARTVYQL